MRFTSLTDLAVESCRDRYDLAIFASGFEARATALAEQLGNEVARDIVVLGFRTQRGILSRQRNDAFYSSVIGVSPVIPEANQDDLVIFEALERVCEATTGPIRILVDYSVMTRSWYAAALNWLRLSSRTSTVTVDFVYAQGSYQGSHDPLQITDISAIDGFEGVVSGKRNTSALFCLGFDKYATLAVHERIEPEEFTCFIVTNGRDFPVLPDISGQNASLIAMSGQSEVVLPLASVSEQFRVICEYLVVPAKAPQGAQRMH